MVGGLEPAVVCLVGDRCAQILNGTVGVTIFGAFWGCVRGGSGKELPNLMELSYPVQFELSPFISICSDGYCVGFYWWA